METPDAIEIPAWIKTAWLAAKAGILEERQLVFVKLQRTHGVDDPPHGNEIRFYKCPCGGRDHYASRSTVEVDRGHWPSEILNCYETGKQWLVRHPDVPGIIRGEEEKYLKLLERAPAIVAKVVAQRGWSDATLAFLKDTHGIDEDLARELHVVGGSS